MKYLLTTFLRGLSVVLPIVLTLWFVVWMAQGAESVMSRVFVFFLPEELYVTGLGVAFGMALIFAAGVLVRVVVVRQLWEWVDRLLTSVPLVRSVYNALRDFLGFFSTSVGDDESRVVAVDVGGEARLVGFVTTEDGAPPELGDMVSVYMPMSYMVGGYTLLVPRDRIVELAWSAEEAMRFALTAGIQKE